MQDSNKYVVYTCVTNGYDRLQEVDSSLQGGEFFCFTDCPNKVPSGWRTLSFLSPPRLQNGHDINRFHKTFSHHLFPSYRYSIYIDGNIEYLGDYDELIECFQKSNAAVGAFCHPQKRNLISEVEACKKHAKFDSYDLMRVEQQIKIYEKSGFDVASVISANYFLVRDHNHPSIHAAMSLLWSHLFEYSKRDQMSLNFCLWEEKVPFVFLDEINGVDAKKLLRNSHHMNFIERILYFIRGTIFKLLNHIVK